MKQAQQGQLRARVWKFQGEGNSSERIIRDSRVTDHFPRLYFRAVVFNLGYALESAGEYFKYWCLVSPQRFCLGYMTWVWGLFESPPPPHQGILMCNSLRTTVPESSLLKCFQFGFVFWVCWQGGESEWFSFTASPPTNWAHLLVLQVLLHLFLLFLAKDVIPILLKPGEGGCELSDFMLCVPG